MNRSRKSKNEEKKAFSNHSNYYSTSELSQKIPGTAKKEMGITNSANANSTSPVHSVNNAN